MTCRNIQFTPDTSKMSFKKKTNIDNITFAELDDLINDWIYETREMQGTFVNQADELKMVSKNVALQDVKCAAVNNALIQVKCLYFVLEQILKRCEEYHNQFNCLVLDLERKCVDLYDKDVPKDKLRVKIYETAEKINETLLRNQSITDDLTIGLIKNDRRNTQDEGELVARILMRQLSNLEMIEIKVQQMFNQVTVLNCKIAQLKCTCR